MCVACGLLAAGLFRRARPRVPARKQRGDDKRRGEDDDQEQAQQYPVMPVLEQHGFFLSPSRMEAEGRAGKAQGRQFAPRQRKERVTRALVYSAFTTAAGKKTSTLRRQG
jgi:hypothetical protein